MSQGAMKEAAQEGDRRLPSLDVLFGMHRRMVGIRQFEERVRTDYLARRMPGFTHSYVGEEAVAVGGCAALEPGDLITSTHRGHGHAIAKGVGFPAMMAELYGKLPGACAGRGGSMHIADFSLGMLGANGIVGGGFGLAAGAALAAQFLGNRDLTLCFFGDGAINKGQFHESINFTALRRLPVIFLCENNQFAQYTAIERTTAGALADRGTPFGVPGAEVDGNDVLAVYQAVRTAADRARRGEGPSLIIANTYRFYGHNVGEAVPYRSEADVAERRKRDPIPRYEAWLQAEGLIDAAGCAGVWEEVTREVDESVAFALAAADPDPATAMDDLYASTRAAWSTQ
ncbi:MAG: thiamine pyrophosphate-dependent dehydrogenase E1 component subunit alpha [Rhizobiales bacterium]|nr:thiamine pyrophosphate-dependent dehydrogenase E1 component subunit alpha [Hyphomicrobiales bacterium]